MIAPILVTEPLSDNEAACFATYSGDIPPTQLD